MQTFGEKLEELRLERRLSKSELGNQCNPPLDHSFISRLESGERDPSDDSLIRILNVLNARKALGNDALTLCILTGVIPPVLRPVMLGAIELLPKPSPPPRRWSNRKGAKNINVTRVDAVGRTIDIMSTEGYG